MKTEYWSQHEQRSYSELDVDVFVSRRSRYYITKILLILLLLVIMSWIIFFIPASDLADRASVAFTLFLAAVIFFEVRLNVVRWPSTLWWERVFQEQAITQS
jgi:hypothetical protein